MYNYLFNFASTSYIILSTTVDAAMLEVYLLQQWNVV